MRFALLLAAAVPALAVSARPARAQATDAALEKLSPDRRAELERVLTEARKANLPTEPIAERIAASRSKGMPEAEIVAAAIEVKGRLATSARALGDAGRSRLDPHEITLGALILERGATYPQLESVIRTAPASRSLVVPFEVLIKLTERGRSVGSALAQVSGKLVARASDGEITALLSKAS